MNPATIRDQIDRVLRSRTFAGKTQLRKLLEILHKNMDAQTTLGPDLVIKELWPTETKTKRSADVATEMNRLRHALESYYDGEGKDDPIRICLPNRSPTVAGGAHEKRWIVATPRNGAQGLTAVEHPPAASQADPRGGSKIAASIAGVVVVLAAVAYVFFRVLATPEQPKFGRLEGLALVIMNAEGKELWRKPFPEGFGPDSYYAPGLASRLWFADLEGKGHTSVLFSYSPFGPQASRSSILICYSDRGKEKWRWIPGRQLPEFGGSPGTFKTQSLVVLKATANRPLRIVVSSQHDPWWPNQIVLLDSNGKIISEYWHSGGLSYLTLADVDGDGKEEIVATGVSIGYHQATLVVLDPDRVFGASREALRPDLQLSSMGTAQEKLRLLFPRSDLNKALFTYNGAQEPVIERGSIRLAVQECITPPGCLVWYEFENYLHLITAYAGDEFRSTHARFYQNGKNAHTFNTEEQNAFGKVRCLVGCKTEFVPTGNSTE